jgi:type I restriction enzyme S subunit
VHEKRPEAGEVRMTTRAGYKQTEVGLIPRDWDTVQLGDMNPFVTSGSRGWATFYSDRGKPFIRITNMSRGCIYLDLSDLRLVELPPSASEGLRTALREGDVLISITADIGIIAYVTAKVPTPSYINQHIAIVRFDPAKVDGRFVAYFLASEGPQKGFQALTDTGAKAGMSLLTVRKVLTALPTLEEQRAIAEALSDADEWIASLDRLIAKKRDIKQATMQQLLTGKNRLPGFEKKAGYKQTEVGLLPDEWGVVQIGDLDPFVTSGSRGWAPFYSDKGDPFIRITNMSRSSIYLDLDDLRFVDLPFGTSEGLRTILRDGDVLVSITADIGIISYVTPKITTPSYINQHIAIVRFEPTKVCSQFVSYFLASEGPQKGFQASTDVGAKAGMNLLTIRKLLTALPSLSEQRAIASTLSDMDEELGTLETKREKARAIKQGMMQELLTGRVRLI